MTRYDGELEKEMQGPTFQLLSKMMKVNFTVLSISNDPTRDSNCLFLRKKCNSYCHLFKGFGEEEDHCAWLFHWALNHPCGFLLIQGWL